MTLTTEYDADFMTIRAAANGTCFVERRDRWRVLFDNREDARAWVEWFKTTDLSDDEDPPPCNKIVTFTPPVSAAA